MAFGAASVAVDDIAIVTYLSWLDDVVSAIIFNAFVLLGGALHSRRAGEIGSAINACWLEAGLDRQG